MSRRRVVPGSVNLPDEWTAEHINVQEAYALEQLITLFCADRPEQVKGSTLLVDVDNKDLFHAFQRGKAGNTIMHEIAANLFWLHVKRDFTLKYSG